MNWDEWDASVVDDEVTELTAFAKRFARRSAELAITAGDIPGYEYAEGGAAIRFRVAGRYVVEFRGQSSATGHGMQGSDPVRIAKLRILQEEHPEEPVAMVFIDQRNELDSAQKWQVVWLDRVEPEVVNIQMADKTRKRQGWMVRDLIRGSGPFEFPEEAPPVVAKDQGALL